MYKLLIVDDEQIIVDWLYRLFNGLTYLELDIYKANTGNQAIDWLNRTKIDIVLTDIKMPEMNGMQLLENIKSSWPDCRVIFLTGYNEFEYVYSAIQYEGVSYLLKTEGDSEIIKTVEKAICDIENSFKNKELINKAQQKINMAVPLLQKEYLIELLQGENSVLPVIQQQLDELEIPLNSEIPLLMLLGRIDSLSRNLTQAEKVRLIYTTKLTVEQYLFTNITAAYILYENSYSIWLMQPVNKEESWERTALFVREMLETVQRVCMESLNVGISFALSNDLCSWEKVSEKYYGLKKQLNCHINSGSGIIITCNEYDTMLLDESNDFNKATPSIQTYMNKISILENYLERGQKQDFFELFSEIYAFLVSNHSIHYIPALEVYFSLSLKLLSHISRWGLTVKLAFKTSINKLTNIEEFNNWSDAAEYLQMLSREIFELQEFQQEKREKDTIAQIQQYILNHLSEDISLVKLGELVYFNPSYLSRLFKQMTGINISEHIHKARINKAKELLGGTDMKIHEIAAAIGFESPAYFTKFFRKATNMTSHEYRDFLIRK